MIRGGANPDVQRALDEAVAAAREMRREIERRLARSLDGFDGQGA